MSLPTQPIAQDYTVIQEHDGSAYRTDAPALYRLLSGRIICSYVLMQSEDPRRKTKRAVTTVVKASDDDGRTWFELARLPDEEMALLFSDPDVVERCRTQRQGYYPYERLYLLGMKAWRGDLILRASDDGGGTWSAPVLLRSGSHWNTATGYVIHENRLYWCVGAPSPEGVFNKAPRTRTLALAGDFSKDLLTPEAWRFSDYVEYPGTPDVLRRGGIDNILRLGVGSGTKHDHWLEGNMVLANGQLRGHYRLRVYGSTQLCALCLLEDNGSELNYRFARFYATPAAHNHFHIVHDPESGLYWMTANMVTHGIQRRILTLHFSYNALDWLPAAYLVVWPHPSQAANYSGVLIDGRDLLVACRTARAAPNYHDNDLVTFHRVRDFRRLAEPLMPGPRSIHGPADEARAMAAAAAARVQDLD